MKFFLDSANIADIHACLARGVISGVTVNQSLLAKEPKCDPLQHIADIAKELAEHEGKPHLSFPLYGTWEEALGVLETIEKLPIEVAVKVPVSWDNLSIIKAFANQNIMANATCVFSVQQADMAVAAGASIVSVFVGRANDAKPNYGYDVLAVSKKRHPDTLILAGSVRRLQDVDMVEQRGADIATISRTLFEEMANEIHSTQSAAKFDEDFQTWISK